MILIRGTLLLFLILLTSCAGYQLGTSKPTPLRGISSIHLQLVENRTQIPRAAAHTSNALADAITRDGTYRLGNSEQADARLETILHTIHYTQVRSSLLDTLRSEELEMTVELHWTLVDPEDPTRVFDEGTATGTTRFFVDPNLQTARQTAISDALQRASQSLVARIAYGF